VIFRATEQWFTSIDGFKADSLEAIDTVQWLPSTSINRIRAMVENRSDWCISRQRTWGVPLPIFYCSKCEKAIINDTTLKTVIDLFSREGSDAWFALSASEILPEGYKCPECGGTEFTKEKDIMDVWFDSGTSHAAVLETREELRWPADLYIEGSDQHRGWFQSSLLTSVGALGKAPYKFVLTHGFTVDGEGKKMSKSLGNSMAPEEVIQKYGADLVRLWAVSSDYSADVRISDEILGQTVDSYRKIRNTIRFILGNLNGFNPKTESVEKDGLEKIDRWLFHRLQIVTKTVLQAYKNWQFHVITKELLNFCNIEMSSFYLDIVKDRLYCSGPSKKRTSSQTVLYHTLLNFLSLIAPVLSFTAEEAYKNLKEEILLPSGVISEESVHLTDFPDVDDQYIDEEHAKTWDTLIEIRKEVMRQIEALRSEKTIGHPLESVVDLFAEGEVYKLLDENREELAPIFVVSAVNLIEKGGHNEEKFVDVKVRKSEYGKCERCWKYLESVGADSGHPNICGRCVSVIKKYYS
jgi:isoleucyl-tRNA synthetase